MFDSLTKEMLILNEIVLKDGLNLLLHSATSGDLPDKVKCAWMGENYVLIGGLKRRCSHLPD